MRLRILSRSSALAVAQAQEVARALGWPSGASVDFLTRESLGDRESEMALARSSEKGLFTADLSDALVAGDADIVVHSWKDLPIEARSDTVVAGTLPRADVRDLLLVPRDVVRRAPTTLRVLTSSPRRRWQVSRSLAPLLPWRFGSISPLDIRGNVPTRLDKLLRGDGDALVVAKAALDRLLGPHAAADARAAVRRALESCSWTVLPIRTFPAAPAQGALAIEVAAARSDLVELVGHVSDRSTYDACRTERQVLASVGGGCQEALGATVLHRSYGTITSVQGRHPNGSEIERWSLESTQPLPPKSEGRLIWPGPGEQFSGVRAPRKTDVPSPARALWVTRADALPEGLALSDETLVWTPGERTWRALAARGIWVNGCADGLGDAEAPGADALAGQPLTWRVLTHGRSGRDGAIPTYDVHYTFPLDLGSRTHFFWTSGSAFLAAVERYPEIRHGWHASGPGRTAQVIRAALPDAGRASIWLDYHLWLTTVLE